MLKASLFALIVLSTAACQIPDTTPVPAGEVYRAIVSTPNGTQYVDKDTRRGCQKARTKVVVYTPGAQLVQECLRVKL